MSEVHRYQVVTMMSDAGNTIGYDPHGPEVVMASEFDRVTAERDGLQLSLNTADQTIDDLSAAISRRTHRVRELESQLSCAVDALNEVVKVSAMYEKPFEVATLAIGELSASALPATA